MADDPSKGAKGRGSREKRPKTVYVKLSTTQRVVDFLKQLVGTEMYGKSHTEIAEALLREKLREIFGDAAVAGPPPPKKRPPV